MSEELTQASASFEKAKAWLLVVEKGYQLKEQQLREAQKSFQKAANKLAEIRNKEEK